LYFLFPRITYLLKKKKRKEPFCLLLYILMFEDTQRSARLADDDEKRTVRLRFYRVFRRAVVPHAMAVQTILSAGR
jgi:hypothetical protein